MRMVEEALLMGSSFAASLFLAPDTSSIVQRDADPGMSRLAETAGNALPTTSVATARTADDISHQLCATLILAEALATCTSLSHHEMLLWVIL